MTAVGLAGLYSAMAPRVEDPPPPVDLDAIHAAGWRTGFAAGEAEAKAALAPLCASLAAAAAALKAATLIETDTLRPLFATLVTQIATAVLMAELTAGTVVLLPLVDAALAQVSVDETASLHGHPDTIAALHGHVPGLATVADASLAPDTFQVSGATFMIETSLAARLADIVGAMA